MENGSVNYDVKNYDFKDMLTVAAMTAIILLLILFFSPKYSGWPTTVHDVMVSINENKSEIDYKEYLSVEVRKSEVIFNKTHMDQEIINNDFCNLVYNVYLKNITNKDVEVGFKFYIPNEMTTSIIFVDTTVGDLKSSKKKLKPGQGYDITLSTLMKHPNKLNIEENEIYEKLKDTLYMELIINGKKAYDIVKYTPQ